MGRKRKPGSEGEPVNLGIRVTADLIEELDAETDRIEVEAGFKPSRAQLVKLLLGEALTARAERRKKK